MSADLEGEVLYEETDFGKVSTTEPYRKVLLKTKTGFNIAYYGEARADDGKVQPWSVHQAVQLCDGMPYWALCGLVRKLEVEREAERLAAREEEE